jgi:hypothetical protein
VLRRGGVPYRAVAIRPNETNHLDLGIVIVIINGIL